MAIAISAKWLHARLESFHLDKELICRDTPLGRVPKTLRSSFSWAQEKCGLRRLKLIGGAGGRGDAQAVSGSGFLIRYVVGARKPMCLSVRQITLQIRGGKPEMANWKAEGTA